jgi:hypothetical protein
LRASGLRPKPLQGLPSLGCQTATNSMVRAMSFKKYSALIASLSAVALMLVAGETSAGAAGGRGGMTAPHVAGHRPFGHNFRHRGQFGPQVWPDDSAYDSAYGQAPADVGPSGSHDVHVTTTYDVPWDWAHRLPPNVAPSDRAYVPSCSVEGVTVPGNNGEAHTVNVTSCH